MSVVHDNFGDVARHCLIAISLDVRDNNNRNWTKKTPSSGVGGYFNKILDIMINQSRWVWKTQICGRGGIGFQNSVHKWFSFFQKLGF